MKHSIRNKILALNVSGIFFCALLLGAIGYYFANSYFNKDSENYLKVRGERESARISDMLENVEQYVKTLNYVVLDEIKTSETIETDSLREKHTQEILNFTHSTIRNVSGAISVYLRYNPKLAPPTSGVFWAKTSRDGEFVTVEPTDFSKYDPSDSPHVGWYYIPIREGKPIWMSPYINRNINIYMISYVVPLFKFNKEVGIIGVDIDFSYLTQEIAKIKLYREGFAFLEDSEGRIAYHPTIKMGDMFLDNGEYKIVRCPIQNGMNLVLAVPVSEFNHEKNMLALRIGLLVVIITILSIILSIIFARSITQPLTKLTQTANQMTQGNLDVSFDTSRKDEIGELSKSFEAAKNYINEYLNHVKGIAFKDALTGIRNRNAYNTYVEEIKDRISEGNLQQLGIVALDVNNLKKINDTYGHDRGNELLINATKLICKTFAHSPVFRMGGDEFLVILINSDYANRERLMSLLRVNMAKTEASTSVAWEQVSVAAGLATYDIAKGDNFETVCKLADEAMYKNKKEMKMERV